jgi:hypothetical protein
MVHKHNKFTGGSILLFTNTIAVWRSSDWARAGWPNKTGIRQLFVNKRIAVAIFAAAPHIRLKK